MCAIEMQLILDTFILFVFVFVLFSHFFFVVFLIIHKMISFHTYLYRRCINFNLAVQRLKFNVICSSVYVFIQFYLIFHNPYFTYSHPMVCCSLHLAYLLHVHMEKYTIRADKNGSICVWKLDVTCIFDIGHKREREWKKAHGTFN